MESCTNMRYGLQCIILVSLLFAAALLFPPVAGENSALGERLILNVYLDFSGKALVTGYAENVSGLDFLNSSEFSYENDSHQLYALTDDLTAKVSDLWTLRFDARGSFEDYRVTFYLPREMSLGEINASTGLGYLLSASNESLVADVQGYEVTDPQISIQYRQPLSAGGAAPSSPPPAPAGGFPPVPPNDNANLILLLVAAALIMAGSALAIVMGRRKGESLQKAPASGPEIAMPPAGISPQAEVADAAAPSLNLEPGVGEMPSSEKEPKGVSSAASPSIPENERAPENVPELAAVEEELLQVEEPGESGVANDLLEKGAWKGRIEVSSEMEAVMQTLTARERAVITTLIDHSGRMTQAEIRYETGTPKSSLTGILISLERRKLVTKKEWGRTNIIELSEWFLSKKEHS
jgi:hypothetical protein